MFALQHEKLINSVILVSPLFEFNKAIPGFNSPTSWFMTIDRYVRMNLVDEESNSLFTFRYTETLPVSRLYHQSLHAKYQGKWSWPLNLKPLEGMHEIAV
jgi:hypothetical protein